jgi:hypothetical protein
VNFLSVLNDQKSTWALMRKSRAVSTCVGAGHDGLNVEL